MSWLEFWKELDRAAERMVPPSYSGGDECPESGKTISRDRARTIQAELRIQRGFHPFGLRLREPRGETCGACGHLREVEYAKTYFKCALRGETKGPATDVRKKWPACERWVSEKSEARP